MWELLNNDDANGVITLYEVCYKASDTPTDIDCNSKESVNGDTREVVLDILNETTTYNVAVQAETSQGFGPLGSIRTNKTLEASEYIFLPNYDFTELFFIVAGLEVRNKGKGRLDGLGGGQAIWVFSFINFGNATSFSATGVPNKCKVVQASLKVTIQIKILHALEFTGFFC